MHVVFIPAMTSINLQPCCGQHQGMPGTFARCIFCLISWEMVR